MESVHQTGASRAPRAPAPGVRRSLTTLRAGQRAVVCATELPASDAKMLGAMGLRSNATIRVCSLGEPCIVEVHGQCGLCCRVGLSRPIAQRVLVEALEGSTT